MEATLQIVQFIGQFEGCKLQAYQDQAGIWTIGYGHTGPEVEEGLVWTQDQADTQFMQDLQRFVGYVGAYVKVAINENQLTALTSFCYNLGPGNLKVSGLLKLLNQGNYSGAADQFLLWNRVNHYVNAGLTRRRQAERALFLQPPQNNT